MFQIDPEEIPYETPSSLTLHRHKPQCFRAYWLFNHTGNPETADLPCVAVTAYHTSKLREDAISAGFTAYFAKPIDATTFARRLEELL